jgi:hypothetical protein
MSRLLYLQASPRRKRPTSIAVADAFVKAYRKAKPSEIEGAGGFNPKHAQGDLKQDPQAGSGRIKVGCWGCGWSLNGG